MQLSPNADRAAPGGGSEKKLIYFADPMCSWCWGFAPVIHAIGELIGDRAGVRLVMGGLRAGETRAMTTEAKSNVCHHWQQVQDATGQQFSFAFFERETFVYDTEPACRAVVVMRSFAPDAALSYLKALQQAFYMENRDITDPAVLASVALPFGLDPEVFSALFSAPEIVAATRADFNATFAAGITGFPTVVLRDGTAFTFLTMGFRSLDELRPQLDDWLAG